jgi:hypothetical protein
MAKGRKRKKVNPFHMDADQPTPEQMRSGEFEREFVTHAESATKAMAHKRRQSRSALEYMRGQGSLTDEQFYSAQQIAQIAEQIERSVGVSCASLEARVDCSGSARNAVNESLYRVRAEGAYTEWRAKLPLPRRMFIDMVTLDAGLSRIAAEHNMGWPRARKMLLKALDEWPAIFEKYAKTIGQDELDRQHARLRA